LISSEKNEKETLSVGNFNDRQVFLARTTA
jgi:hypothetical protein